ncbi:MAG TPA: cell division protein FtsQ/DivIB [Gammaproteobacteria bacterium]
MIGRRANRRRPPQPRRGLARLLAVRVPWHVLVVPPLTLGVLAAAGAGLHALLDRPVQKLVLEGSFQRVTPIQIEAAVAPELRRGFLSLDLIAVRDNVEALPWVDKAEARRAWPDTLVVTVTEHRAAARWGEDGLLDVRGELFIEGVQHEFPELPKLAGPPGSEREVAERYLAVRGQLAAANLALESLELDERGAWRIVLAGGQEIRLGRHALDERLERFFEVVTPALGPELERVRYVDLRYTNGFAVGWVNDEGGAETARHPRVIALPGAEAPSWRDASANGAALAAKEAAGRG